MRPLLASASRSMGGSLVIVRLDLVGCANLRVAGNFLRWLTRSFALLRLHQCLTCSLVLLRLHPDSTPCVHNALRLMIFATLWRGFPSPPPWWSSDLGGGGWPPRGHGAASAAIVLGVESIFDMTAISFFFLGYVPCGHFCHHLLCGSGGH